MTQPKTNKTTLLITHQLDAPGAPFFSVESEIFTGSFKDRKSLVQFMTDRFRMTPVAAQGYVNLVVEREEYELTAEVRS
jgi:hypothetical protein